MLIIESIILCMLFTLFVYIISNKPIKTLYNYPPKIQQRVKSLDQYKDKIPTHKNKIFAKLSASLIIIVLLSLLLHYVNNCSTFSETNNNLLKSSLSDLMLATPSLTANT